MKKRAFKTKYRLWAILFWIAVWQLAAMAIGTDFILATPLSTLRQLFELMGTADYWASIGRSGSRILIGFCAAVLSSVGLAALSVHFRRVRELLAPAVAAVKSVPVASFTIVALLLVGSKNLSVLISFLISFPLVYSNVIAGIESVGRSLLEMAEVFRVPFCRRLIHIYIPHVFPFFQSALSVAMGLAWKSGIAAEVIGIPDGTIGDKLYKAKAYLWSDDTLAWTVTIIVISLVFEAVVSRIMKKIAGRLEKW